MDQFKYFARLDTSGINIELPSQVTTPDPIKKALRLAGLSVPSDVDTFWINSRRCILTRRSTGESLGELLEVAP